MRCDHSALAVSSPSLPAPGCAAAGGMRLALASDVHADCWQRPGQALDWAAAPAADVLLLAGDLHDDQQGSAEELRKAAQRYPLVLWVDGNHEAFHHGAALQSSAPSAAGLQTPANVVFLGARQTHLVDGVLFVGACGWWDFDFCRPECEPAAARDFFNRAAVDDCWFDAPSADGRPFDAVVQSLAEADHAHVAAAVTAAQTDARVRAIVILTHTVPHRALLRKGVYPRSLLEAAFYGSSLMETIPALDAARKIALWGFGHSHAGADAVLGHVRYVSQPRGRPDDFARGVYAPMLLHLGIEGRMPAVTRLDVVERAPAEAPAAEAPQAQRVAVAA